MGTYKLSVKAESDLANIYEYGIKAFGLKQAQRYLLEMHNFFETLADRTNLGWDASEFIPSLKRFSYKSHTIFYLVTTSGILIIRVLNQRMDYEKYL